MAQKNFKLLPILVRIQHISFDYSAYALIDTLFGAIFNTPN